MIFLPPTVFNTNSNSLKYPFQLMFVLVWRPKNKNKKKTYVFLVGLHWSILCIVIVSVTKTIDMKMTKMTVKNKQ